MDQTQNNSSMLPKIVLIVLFVFLGGLAYWFWNSQQNDVKAPAVPTPMLLDESQASPSDLINYQFIIPLNPIINFI
ncbi:hypothetical protein HGA91_06625 [candidate division WWE3 bacterium]|nr:hypothetical protein [candidate division WWE3 bacterium]